MPTSIHNEQEESFHRFFDGWIVEQRRYLDDLVTASKTQGADQRILNPLISIVVDHYKEYYRAKTEWSKKDVLSVLSPAWMSSLEYAFFWIGGWRPTVAFHLLYSKSGLQMEAKLEEIIGGFGTDDLGCLSSCQLTLVDELHRKTIVEERKISESMAKVHESGADSSMVELSHAVSQLQNGEGSQDDRVASALAPKKEGLADALENADELRLRTLQDAISILEPKQAVHFLIAAAELHLRIHEWGQKIDDEANHVGEEPSRRHHRGLGH